MKASEKTCLHNQYLTENKNECLDIFIVQIEYITKGHFNEVEGMAQNKPGPLHQYYEILPSFFLLSKGKRIWREVVKHHTLIYALNEMSCYVNVNWYLIFIHLQNIKNESDFCYQLLSIKAYLVTRKDKYIESQSKHCFVHSKNYTAIRIKA